MTLTQQAAPIDDLWEMRVLSQSQGAIIVSPPCGEGIPKPATYRRIARIEAGNYLLHEQCIAIAEQIVSLHNAAVAAKEQSS